MMMMMIMIMIIIIILIIIIIIIIAKRIKTDLSLGASLFQFLGTGVGGSFCTAIVPHLRSSSSPLFLIPPPHNHRRTVTMHLRLHHIFPDMFMTSGMTRQESKIWTSWQDWDQWKARNKTQITIRFANIIVKVWLHACSTYLLVMNIPPIGE